MTASTIPVAITGALSAYDPWLRLVGNASKAAVAADPADPTSTAPSFIDKLKAIKTEPRYLRPNGVEYLPRQLAVAPKTTVQDVAFFRAAYDARMPVLLYGDPGTGKTAVLEAALEDLVTIQGTTETETADFVGSWTQQPDGTYRWVDGPLVVAMLEGRPLLVDEVALVDPRVMAVVYGVMDGRDELVVTANPERGAIKTTDGFCVFGACNPNVPGALMSDALLSRFTLHMEVTTDWGLAKSLDVPANIIQVARNLHLKATNGEVMAAPQLRELLAYREVLTKFGEVIALQNFVGQARSEDRSIVTAQIESVFGLKIKALAL